MKYQNVPTKEKIPLKPAATTFVSQPWRTVFHPIGSLLMKLQEGNSMTRSMIHRALLLAAFSSLALPAVASSDDAWKEFVADVHDGVPWRRQRHDRGRQGGGRSGGQRELWPRRPHRQGQGRGCDDQPYLRLRQEDQGRRTRQRACRRYAEG
ncbi:exported hypothetical protein [Agrobacterium fabacearum TT111]|nr:exported hypothetical protein [Agrobacterium fabacearum TT111]